MNDEIQRIISGKSKVRFGADIQTVLGYLTGSEKSSSMVKTDKHYKKEETKRLRDYICSQNLWFNIDLSNYISEGAEQKVYYDENVLTQDGILYFIDTVFYIIDL